MVFISYSRADYLDNNNEKISNSPIIPILDALDRNGITYWIDVDGNNATNQYMRRIAKAINRSNYVIFISSKTSNHIDSYWPIKEIQLASEKHKKILPIKIDESEFHEDLVLPLAGLDILEYYKNPQQSVTKLIKVVSNSGDPLISKKMSLKQKIYGVFYILFIGFVSVFLFFSAFATIGACVGYYSNLKEAEQCIDDAFRSRQVTSLNSHTLRCSGDSFVFRYDTLTNSIEFEENDSKLFDKISFESIMMSVSIPKALEKVLKASRRSGNSKSQILVLIGGSIGVFCGYTVGEYIGKSMAVIENEKTIKEYINKKSTKDRLKKIMKHNNQVTNE